MLTYVVFLLFLSTAKKMWHTMLLIRVRGQCVCLHKPYDLCLDKYCLFAKMVQLNLIRVRISHCSPDQRGCKGQSVSGMGSEIELSFTALPHLSQRRAMWVSIAVLQLTLCNMHTALSSHCLCAYSLSVLNPVRRLLIGREKFSLPYPSTFT